jgi:serine phosphatase RsbU (regulator of sigma subunit)
MAGDGRGSDVRSGRQFRPLSVAAAVFVIGMVVTIAVSSVSWVLNHHNEHRLLEVQTHQAGAAIASSVLTLSDPLRQAAAVSSATDGDPEHFRQATSALVGPGAPFVSASLWRVDGPKPEVVATAGAPPVLSADSADAHAVVAKTVGSPTFTVTSIGSGTVARVGYAVAAPNDPRFVVYAERAIPANRQVEVESNSAFADLHFATYLGATIGPSSLATTDLPNSALPLTGNITRETIPFGNSSITLIAKAHGPLGGQLGRDLPWILLLGGTVISLAAATLTYQLVSSRRRAEESAQTVTDLYTQLDSQYGEQRSIAYGLQQALLPAYNPSIRNLEIASRYAAGAKGVDIGGDWYSIIALDKGRFGFVVGDVSGRGVSAAAIMARLRFTMRAYLIEGHPPEVVLAMCSRQIDLAEDGHFATVIVGVGDIDSRTITVANAGHFDPLVVSDGQVSYTTTDVGLPLGVSPTSYEPTTFVMSEGSTFLAFTDGLVERRGESIDVGLDRLAAAASAPEQDLDALLTRLLTELTGNRAEDDVALLAFRWTHGDAAV